MQIERVLYPYSNEDARNLNRSLEDEIKKMDRDKYVIVETSGKYPSRLMYFINKGLIDKVRFIIKEDEESRIVTSCKIKSCLLAQGCDKIDSEIVLHTDNKLEIDKYVMTFGEENITIKGI